MSVLDQMKNGSCLAAVMSYYKSFHSSPRNTTIVDARKELNELVALAELGERIRWVPVSEKLPKEGMIVDLYIVDTPGNETSDQIPCRLVEMTVYTDERHNNRIYFDDVYCSSYELSEVTHWRPAANDRPEPPKEGVE